ncbi:MAG: alanine:cation symporter family protein [Micavibrio aeruginosavorus]|uniref:Alanine:cation symporter family protein n=1 Tax=Micavibrio aeruginosavorus TaxID=349221 RepID=A0A7T5R0Y0_9BACT|nr:MAG: alanine:cation symporter family protein [Micavibrio aeruginosavorus]
MSIDQKIDAMFKSFADVSEAILFYGVKFNVPDAAGVMVEKSFPLILIWLMAAGLFFTAYLWFPNLRYFWHSFNVVRGKHEEPDAEGQINNFQALMASLAGTVGLGNIAGVAVAVSVGGPGAVVWMVMMAFIGMSTKFAEVTAGVKYRRCFVNARGEKDVSGGPMYYLQDIFSSRGKPKLGKILAIVFALCCIGGAIGGGNMFQANQTYIQFLNASGGDASWLAGKGWMFGIVLSILTGIVIIGGIKSIANVSSMLVPVMAILYLLAGFFVIIMNFDQVPEALGIIFKEAFTPTAGLAGLAGAMLTGIQRASFSNEAGLGSAAIVQSCARTQEPVRQGIAAMMGPFIDTVIICLMTALVIVITGVYESGQGMAGVELTSNAFASEIPWAPWMLAFTVFMFAYSTLIGWGYYGVKASTFIFGEKPIVEMTFKIVFCLFVIVGCAADLTNVIRFTDSMILSMAFPNLIGLYVMAPELKRDLQAYVSKYLSKQSK